MNNQTYQPALVDSHCHLHMLDLPALNQSMDEVMEAARANGVEHFLCVSTELDDLNAMLPWVERYHDVSLSVGIHPNTMMHEELSASQLVQLANHPACIAIGETGLDYYRLTEESGKSVQQARFREHIHASRLTKKPLIIHTREASEDTLAMLAGEGAAEVGGVMHCFVEDWSVARRALDLNFYISLSGIVTFKNATQVQDVARKVPLDRLLIETDSPYLAPVPFRGKQNHPALVKHVALGLSELLQIDFETLAAQTTDNFYRCFRLERGLQPT